uniref:Protein FAR1-RELATED SEQUENCE n=1 Tax=Aegilops tauschii subsp. strangulata TaxID=200361 RepID=A0A453KVR1_AEGTS
MGCVVAQNISAGCTTKKILNFLYDYYTGDRTHPRDGPTTPLEAAFPAQASDDFVPRDPPRSTTKGRAKSRRYKSALELHPKKKNKCTQCQSTEHTAGVCPLRLL